MTRQQFKKLSFGRKISFLLEKYLAATVLGVFLVSAIGTLIYEDYFKHQPVLSVGMIDVNQESSDDTSFDEFLTQAGYSTDDCYVKIEKRYQFGRGEDDLALMPEQIMVCDTTVGKTDIYFWNTSYMEENLANSILVDLRAVMPEEFLIANEENLIYTAPLLDGGYPCGLSLRDNQWVTEHNYYGDCAVGISRKSKNPELMSQFLQYLS